MFTLIMIVLTSSGAAVTSMDFTTQNRCLEAMGKMVDVEVSGVTIKARCVAK